MLTLVPFVAVMKKATGGDMHPFLQAQLASLHNEDLKAQVARGRGRSGAKAGREDGRAPADVVIRRTTSSPVPARPPTPRARPALAALPALDAAPLPLGPSLVAEIAGVPRAVLPLDGGP